MNKGCVFVLGFLAAIFLVTLIPFLNGKNNGSEPQQTDEVVDEEVIVQDFLKQTKPVENIQYIDIRGKHGEVTLHTNMSKDSVKILVGKPTRVDLRTYGNDAHEDWEYIFQGEGLYGTPRELRISFINGELKEIHEY